MKQWITLKPNTIESLVSPRQHFCLWVLITFCYGVMRREGD